MTQLAYDKFDTKVGYQGGSFIMVIPYIVASRLKLKKGDYVTLNRPEGKQKYRFYKRPAF